MEMEGAPRDGDIRGGSTAAEERLLKKEVVLVSRPQGMPNESNFEVRQSELVLHRPPSPGILLLKVLWMSVDPYLRETMNEDNGLTMIPPIHLGQPIVDASLSKVIASGDEDYKEGDIVHALTPITNYLFLPSDHFSIRKIDIRAANIPLNHYLGVLGFPGHTAWVGINIITQLQPEDEVFISSAAGAVGVLAGQLAKLKGCRVVGSAGTDEKVRMLKELYHFDDAFNYKTEEDLNVALQRYFPSGFDVYFENVGGKTLEAALENIRPKGRIIACGMISQYNKDYKDRDGVRNLMHVIGKSLKLQGYLIGDYYSLWHEFVKEVSELLVQGKIRYQMDVLGLGIEEFVKAFVGLLRGENTGKALLLVDVNETS